MNVKQSIGHFKRPSIIAFLFLIFSIFFPINCQLTGQAKLPAKKALTLTDMMKFKSIKSWQISEKGDWVVYCIQPGRGNSETIISNINTGEKYTIPRGTEPVISKDSRWVATAIQPDALEMENSPKDKKPKPGMALLNTETGKIISVQKVKGFIFSKDSNYLVYRLYPKKSKEEKQESEQPKNKDAEKKKKVETTPLVIKNLISGEETRIENVGDSALDPESLYLAYSIQNKNENKEANGLYIKKLHKKQEPIKKLHSHPGGKYSNLTWSKKKSRLAFIFHKKTKKKEENKPKENGDDTYESELMVWDGLTGKFNIAVSKKSIPEGWLIPGKNKLTWSKDAKRLFFGFKPVKEYLWTKELSKSESSKKQTDLFDIDSILDKKQVDVWHWDDPIINSQQKKQWKRLKKRIYPSVYHIEDNWFVHLTDMVVPELSISENPAYALGFSRLPYRKESTWDDIYKDVYIVDLVKGSREKLLSHYNHTISLSPDGGYIVYYKDKNWHLYNIRLRTTRNLTASLKFPFYREDFDYPSEPPGYGIAGWTKDGSSVLIYDRYDIWQFFTGSPNFICISGGQGRDKGLSFRIKKLDTEVKFFKKSQRILLEATSLKEKYRAIYSCNLNQKGVQLLAKGPYWFTLLGKAKKADRVVYTRESFEEFPDIWAADLNFDSPQKVSDVNPQIKNFLWGKAQLIEWKSLDGIPLQGAVFVPENFDKNRRYPVLVYIYRKLSQRLYRFNPIEINHRPCFPYYTSNDYVLFLPDIQFEIGRPGISSLKSFMPGIQKLIDKGIADPKAIALHGHSWGGYQTAYIITQTDLFAAAIAGAPVSNMTSAYNGIRKGSGKARQFQYEISQSRIGAGLVDAPELYFQNSPVFYADRINTPLLIQFGDQDDAVPWQQGVELYLTMRRLNKNCIFLQYNKEPHHLKKYANKLDYTIKMKEFLDYYLKKTPAPDWISEGIRYRKR